MCRMDVFKQGSSYTLGPDKQTEVPGNNRREKSQGGIIDTRCCNFFSKKMQENFPWRIKAKNCFYYFQTIVRHSRQ